jgi:hypothetical protein
VIVDHVGSGGALVTGAFAALATVVLVVATDPSQAPRTKHALCDTPA